jgi:phosphoglycerate kinase
MSLIDALPIEGKRVLIRVDFNVPLQDGVVADDSRIRAALPTIEHAIERGARVILSSHLGRPKGKPDPALSLAPAGEVLAGHLNREIYLSDRPVGPAATRLARDLRDGQILLLENVRYHPGETKNDDGLARALSDLADFYVNDAFGTAHRAHASTVGVAAHIRDKAAGYLIAREVDALTQLLNAPKTGFTAVLGGAKVSDKIAVIERLLGRVERILVGGAMAYTFLKARGHQIGDSRVEETQLETASHILTQAKRRGVEVVLPIDHGAADGFSPTATRIDVDTVDLPAGLMGLDIGAETSALFSAHLAEAKTIFWNGPMGVFEFTQFAQGTRAVADAVADSPAWTVVGGGDSVRAVTESGRAGDIAHISTGGGASLEFLEGRDLPGLVALGIRRRK